LEDYLMDDPDHNDDEADPNGAGPVDPYQDDDDSVALLRDEVDFLEAELRKERAENEHLFTKVAAARQNNDEWVAMISLLRHETESVLHRHNILLESDMALDAADRLHQVAEDERAAEAAVAKELAAAQQQQQQPDAATVRTQHTESRSGGGAGTSNDTVTMGTSDVTAKESETGKNTADDNDDDNVPLTDDHAETSKTVAIPLAADEANDGDDEGSNEEDEERELTGEGTVVVAGEPGADPDGSGGNNNKRGGEDQESDANRKRRKV